MSIFGRLFGKWGLISRGCQSIKFFIQRGRKGYCDKDLWEMNTWFAQTVSRMMKEFSKVNISFPTESDTICPGYNEMSDEEMIKLLATDGMLVKRPLLIRDDTVLVGFREEEYKQLL